MQIDASPERSIWDPRYQISGKTLQKEVWNAWSRGMGVKYKG